MFLQPSEISFKLPGWIDLFSQRYVSSTDLNIRMAFVISAAKKNVEQGSGGPFAAAVFEIETGKLVSLGVNLVTTQGLSILHAEIVALVAAQRKLRTYDLAITRHELVTSAEPCAMCLGAISWSGVCHVATAATDQDVSAIGFDEGPKPNNWIKSLKARGIKVSTNIQREFSCSVLQLYIINNGCIYNSGKS
ncbi:CMP/dCMP deaminase, zinc-binding protein [Psychromonas ingrahamii 37]|uniref:CMP/dCMP deaminase, zinc-binding protein n=1 Tax=Psychromonas ingrahamii (strain DSM 17664 / CCUG 51855 / 37) TaxID=357804 RepID=A1SVS0_PSYIN|nr:nucleoside deaminase [Psychromonas ingrahamii]ABM03585.1 CMP/dCMP deaminase, zinc-binding protein [Psychromonas ingrahamii 37]